MDLQTARTKTCGPYVVYDVPVTYVEDGENDYQLSAQMARGFSGIGLDGQGPKLQILQILVRRVQGQTGTATPGQCRREGERCVSEGKDWQKMSCGQDHHHHSRVTTAPWGHRIHIVINRARTAHDIEAKVECSRTDREEGAGTERSE